MGLLDKVKAGAEQAASSAKRQAQLVETKRELNQAYSELGKIAFGLVGRGEVSHGELAAGVARITELQARLSGDGVSATDVSSGEADVSSGEADIVE